MFIIGQEMHKIKMNNDMIVSCYMVILGFCAKTLEQEGIKSNKTKVGDRYVIEKKCVAVIIT